MGFLSALLWAAILAAAITLAAAAFIFVNAYISGSTVLNRRKKLRYSPETPIVDGKLNREHRGIIEPILAAWNLSDTSLLPKRMDKTFRAQMERSIGTVSSHGLRREFYVTNARALLTGKKQNFTRWNDGGREWREATIEASLLERFIRPGDGTVQSESYYPDASITVRQSRHIRASDRPVKNRDKFGRKIEKKEFYQNDTVRNCFSCGAEIVINAQELVCPYCGAKIVSDFYDWQTESCVIGKSEHSYALEFALCFAAALPVCLAVLLLLAAPLGGFLAGVAALVLGAVAALVALFLFVGLPETLSEKREKQIVRFSKNLLTSCIFEELWLESSPETIDLFVGDPLIKAVKNDENYTVIDVAFNVISKSIAPDNSIVTGRAKHTASYWRVRYPQRLKSSGELVTEKECPSCGGSFMPDEEGCCSYCGYSLRTDNTKWKRVRVQP